MSAAAEPHGGGCGRLAALFADVAYQASRADGRLHIAQFRALRAVLDDVGASRQPLSARDLASLEAELAGHALDAATRRWLWVTAAWVAAADGRQHGAELWLLCELRRALGLGPEQARRLWRLARRHHARWPGGPTAGAYRALRQRVAPACAWPC